MRSPAAAPIRIRPSPERRVIPARPLRHYAAFSLSLHLAYSEGAALCAAEQAK